MSVYYFLADITVRHTLNQTKCGWHSGAVVSINVLELKKSLPKLNLLVGLSLFVQSLNVLPVPAWTSIKTEHRLRMRMW